MRGVKDFLKWEDKGGGLHVLYYGAAEAGLVATLGNKFVSGVMSQGGEVIQKQYPFDSLPKAKSWVEDNIEELLA